MRKDMARLRRLARKAGWVDEGVGGSGHYRMRWPATGDRITLAASPSCPYAPRNARRDLERISGPLG